MLGSFSNPRWFDVERTRIGLDTSWNGDATVYLAAADDPHEPGRQIYQRAIGGEFGPIAHYVAPVVAPPSKDDLHVYAIAKAQSLLAAARRYDLGGVSVLCDATTATGTNLNALDIWAQANPSGTRVWIDNLNARTTLTATQVRALAHAALEYALSVYDPGLASVGAEIDAGTITAFAQIDAATWPV